MEQKYKFISVKPKNEIMRDIHYRMECSIWCEVLDLRKGCPAWIKYKMVGLDEKYAHTSIVEEIICLDDGGLEIHTKNTVYVLKELTEDAD